MTSKHLSLTRPLIALMLTTAVAAASAAAITRSELNDALARHRSDVAVCMSGQSNQDRETCLRDAEGALIEARRGSLTDANATYRANQLKRCEPLPAEQRAACTARMNGAGTTSGSAAAGGIYRELVIRETVAPTAPETAQSAR